MKRIISFVLTCVMLVTLIPIQAFAETTEIASGACGENLIWVLMEDGTLTISGTGDMTDYSIYVGGNAPWYDYSFRTIITKVVIEDGVTSIGDYAFYNCSNMTSVTIPDSVTSIGKSAFFKCSSLTNITMPNSITRVGTYAFSSCSNLVSVSISDSITEIGDSVFSCCTSLTSITIPASITLIQEFAFDECTNLTEIIFLGDAPHRYSNGGTQYAVFEADNVIAYYPAGNSTWTESVMRSYGEHITWVPYGANNDVPGTEDESPDLEINGLSINKQHDNFYIFLGDSHVYNMDAPDSSLYLDLDSIGVIDDTVLTPADITWASSDENIFRVISSGDTSDAYVNLRVEGITEGIATLTATNPDGETISMDVTVVKSNALHFTNIYDTKQYYHAGAFYSAASSISDSVEFFVQFENKQIEGYPCKIEEELIENVSVIEPITLTATVLGTGLSFNRNSYQSTYSVTYDAIEFNKGIYDLLMLFPCDTDSFAAGSSYTVEVTLESDSFTEPVKETYSFTVYDAEKQRVDEHISFINNSTYKVSKQNIYGTNMLELKGDPEYNWSVVTSLDFDNYYEIVLADLLVDMLDVYQVNTSIVPTVLKEWHETYKSLLGDVTTMIKDSYSDVLDVNEMKIDKILKVSKYTNVGDGIYADDDVYQVVLDMFGNVGNVDKIQTFFAAVDDTKSAFSIVKLTGDVVKDFVTWGNSIAVLNAFVETDDNFKQVFRQIANNIPDSEKKMKEAIEDYLNYSEDVAGQFSEIYDSLCDLGVDVALDTFDGIVGEKLWDWAAAKAVGWIGKIPLSGGTTTFASTTAYASLTTAIGSVTTGVSLGLCLSDLICDSSDKAAEMSKIIAMSEYAPYIIQALEYCESNLSEVRSNDAVDFFENAFNLHKACQGYIMEHTVSALEVKADSILQTILGNDEYDELVADILVQKNAIDSMECCSALTNDTIVQTIKVIAIKCPVDVYVYNENGTEIVRIIDDTLESAMDGVTVYIRDSAKFIALPSTQVYSVKIIATDDGTMDYLVMEFDDASQLVRRLEECAIPLAVDRVFTGEVVEELGVVPESYALTYEGTEYVPTEPEHIHSYAAPNFIWSEDNACTATFTCIDGDDTQTVACTVTSETTPATETEAGATVYTATVEFNGQTYTDNKTVEIPATGHVAHITTLIPAVEATCEHTGNIAYYTCSGCDLWFEDAEATKVIEDHNSVVTPLADHSYEFVVTAPTCTEQGYTTNTCSICGDSYVDSYVDATGHSFSEWAETKVANCTENGEESRSCACGEGETREIKALGHIYQDGICNRCGENDPDYEPPSEPSEPDEPGRPCWDSFWDWIFGGWWDDEKCNHEYTSVITTPTCNQKGYTTHTCDKCGDSYNDSYTNALGHQFENGVCTECGKTEKPGGPGCGSIWDWIFGWWN